MDYLVKINNGCQSQPNTGGCMMFEGNEASPVYLKVQQTLIKENKIPRYLL